jgi:HK97 family phage major capsid protein
MTKQEVEQKRSSLFAEADSLLLRAAEITRNEKATTQQLKEADVLMARASGLKQEARSLKSDDERRAKLDQAAKESGIILKREKPATQQEIEAAEERSALRGFFATGAGLRTYTGMADGVEGAYLLPTNLYGRLLEGIAQYSELMDKNNVTLLETEDSKPLGIPQIGLESITSSVVGDNVQTSPVANPVFAKLALNPFTYKSNPVAVSMQLDRDSDFQPTLDVLIRAFSVAIARGAGSDLVNGNGTTAPQGVLTAAADSTITAASSSVFSFDELKAVYFSVNRAYRVSPKCAWMMNDSTYQGLYQMKDSAGRPLISVIEDTERLFGKKILISPDMPTAAGSKAVCFGDFSQYIVRVPRNGVSVLRNAEAYGYVEKLQILYTNFCRLNAALNAPDGTKPIVFAKLHS